jgi:protein tyrosine phosphatase (PTP) superfamily phosphohydrolase (DUF442 family)
MTNQSRSRRICNWMLRLAAIIVVPVICYLAWDQVNHNFGQVRPGHIYRSGQMPASALAQTIRERQIKTILNLRGANPSESWYRDELSATLKEGATHIDIAMSSCVWMSREQLRALVDTLEKAEVPLLIHCAWGSERTGLASAFAELLRPGSTLDDARAQFSIRYLFIRVNDGKVMAEHLDQYESWLRESGAAHSPDKFRQWATEEFRPGHPGREEWPYDPYPLVVVERPGDMLKYKPISDATGAPSRR